MANLTEAKIGRLRWDPSKGTTSGRQIHSDGVVKGLQLRVLAPKADGASTKVFYQAYGPSTNRKLYKVGEWGDITLVIARERARKIRRDFYEHGIDPNQARQQRLQKAQARLTVKELVEEYWDERASEWSPKYLINQRTHKGRLKDYCGSQLADELTVDQIKKLFLEIKKASPSQAEHLRLFGKELYSWAMDAVRIPEIPNPFKLERSNSKAKSQFRIPKRVRKRHLDHTKSEATRLFAMLEDYELPKSVSASQPRSTHTVIAKLYLLLGFRNKELREARWEHVDTKERTILNVSQSKDTPPYKQYLSDMALELLESLGEGHIKFRKGPIFPSLTRGGEVKPISRWNSWTMKIRHDPRMPVSEPNDASQGLDEPRRYITPHDFRRSGATWLQRLGVPLDERTIWKGSKVSNVTDVHYSHAEDATRKKCVLLIEQLLKQIEAGNEETMFEASDKKAQALVTA